MNLKDIDRKLGDMMKEEKIVNKHLDIPFKNFMPGQIIQSSQFNDDMLDIEDKVNEIIDKHNLNVNKLHEHLDDKENPHEVNPHQIGTYEGSEIDAFIDDVKNGNLNDEAITNRVLADACVDNRVLVDGAVTSSKLDTNIGNQIDISGNMSIKERYTKLETDAIIQEKVGDGTYSKEQIDAKFEEYQAGTIVDGTLDVTKLKGDVGRKLDITNNPSISNRYTKSEVNTLIAKNGLPKDWGNLSDEVDDEIVTQSGLGSLPISDVMVCGEFKATKTDVLNIKVQDVEFAKGEFNTLEERLDNVDTQLEENTSAIDVLNVKIQDIEFIKGEFNTLEERFDNVDTQLIHKMNRGENISVSQINKNLGKIDQTYLSDELLKQIAGNTPINSTVANKSITNEKLADKSIYSSNLSEEVFDFLTGNIINGSNIVWEIGSIDANGFDMPSIQRIRSKFIRFNKKGIFKLKDYSKYQQNIIMYDKSFNKIGGTEWQKKDVVLENENCYFVRILLGKLQYVEIPTSEIQAISSSFSIEPYSLIEENVRTKYLINKKNQISYEYGTFNTDGSESSFFPVASVPSRIRNNRFIKINNGVISLTKSDEYKINVILYNENFEKIGGTEWVETDVVISEPCYVRFMISHKDNKEITEDDVLKMSSSVELYGDVYVYNHEENISYSELSNTSIYSMHLKEQHWKVGTLTTATGSVEEAESTNRMRSGYIKLNKGDKISCLNNDFVFGGHIFSLSDKSWVKDIGWQTTGTYIASTDCYLRIVAKCNDDRTLNFNYVDNFVKSLSFVPSYLTNSKEEINYSYLNSTNYTQTIDSIVLNSGVNEVNYIELNSIVRNAQIGIIELNARLTDVNSVSTISLFRDTEKVFEISINTTYFKPYVLKIPFNDENSLFTVKIGSLTTSTKAKCEVKDIKIKFEDIVTKQFNDDNLTYIAHRGDTKFAPENTFPAFMEAKLKGYNAIEVDVEVTSDNELVLLHDSTIDRTSNGTGAISSMTLEQARAYDYGSWKNSKYRGATIPTLKEFLIWCRMTDIKPVLELKTAFSSALANKFVNTLIETKMLDKCDVISFNFNALKSVADVNNSIRFALIGAPSESTIASLKSLGDNIYYSIYGSSLSSSAKLCSSHNLDYIYSTNDGNTIRECYNVGCIGICTDMLILNNCCM